MTATRERNARGQGDRLRSELLDAAADLMAEHGTVDGISLRGIARRAGVSPTAVYRHFDDHVELLQAAVTHCWTNFRGALADAVHPGSDPFADFERMGRAYVAFALEHPGQYRVMFSNRVLPLGDHAPVAIETFDLLVDLVGAILREREDDRDPFFVAVQVHTWIHGIVDLIASNPTEGWPSVDRLLDGLDDALRLGRPS